MTVVTVVTGLQRQACGAQIIEAQIKPSLLVGPNNATGLRGLKHNDFSGNHTSGRILKVDAEETCIDRRGRHAGGEGRSESFSRTNGETR